MYTYIYTKRAHRNTTQIDMKDKEYLRKMDPGPQTHHPRSSPHIPLALL